MTGESSAIREPVAIPRWNAQIVGHSTRVQNLGVAPHDHMMAYEVWIDQG